MKRIMFRSVLVFLIATSCTGDIERNVRSTDPSTWLVFGSALEQGNNYLSGRAELCIQPRSWDGHDMPAGECNMDRSPECGDEQYLSALMNHYISLSLVPTPFRGAWTCRTTSV